MNLSLLQNLAVNRNRLLRSGTQLLTNAPGDPILGETIFFDAAAASSQRLQFGVYDGVNQGTPVSQWRILAGLNRNDEVSGVWVWNPVERVPSGTNPGNKAPFTLGANCYSDDTEGNTRINWVQHLNADLLDGRHAMEWADGVPSQYGIPVYGPAGRLRVGDPVTDWDAVNRKTLLAASQGLIALAPCRAATDVKLVGTRAGNVFTATNPGAFVPDGVGVIVGDRVLLKNQNDAGGTSTGADNGPYIVSTVGTTGVNFVLTRATDADATGELVVGTLVFVEEGTVNKATQWSCQRPAGVGGGSVFVINTDIQLWQKTFQQSSLTAGRGLVLTGSEMHFAQNFDYTLGNMFVATAARTVTAIAPPTADGFRRFLTMPPSAPSLPSWIRLSIDDIFDWPDPILPGDSNTSYRIARFDADDPNLIEDSSLFDIWPNIYAPLNTLITAELELGKISNPFGNLWTNALRLKTKVGAGEVAGMYGIQFAASDSNANHREVVVWDSDKVRTFVGVTAGNIGAVPTSRLLGFTSSDSSVTISPTAAQDLGADRSWNLTVDKTTLDNYWMTLHSHQSASGTKTWYSDTGIDTRDMLKFQPDVVHTQARLTITSGGALLFGPGVSTAPTGKLSYDDTAGSIMFSVKPVLFDATSTVYIKSAAASSGAPSFVLGLSATDAVRKVSPGDLGTFLGSPWLTAPTLTNMAIGYGNGSNQLTGDATKLRWDHVNFRMGINVAVPTATIDALGDYKLNNAAAPGVLPFQFTTTDASNTAADWVSRTMTGAMFTSSKVGSASGSGGAASMEGLRVSMSVNNGTINYLYGIRCYASLGHTVNTPTVASYYAFWSQPVNALGSLGSLGLLAHFVCSDPPASWAPVSEKYGLYVVNHASPAGTVRVAATRLEIAAGGSGERYNLYATGTAPNYLVGNLGLGQSNPTARLEFAVGTTSLAPIRFSTGSSPATLLTVPLSGMVESRGDRLTFTDATPTRRQFAFLDDVDFTNDPNADMGGAVVFSYPYTGTINHAVSTLDGQVFDKDVTIAVRFRVLQYMPQQNAGVWALSSDISGGAAMRDWGLYFTGSTLNFFVRDLATGTPVRLWMLSAATMGQYFGRIIDFHVVRTSGVIAIWINGVNVTPTPSGTVEETKPIADGAATLRFRIGSTQTTMMSYPDRIYSARIYNRALSLAELMDNIRHGVDEQDKWSSTAPIYSSNFATSDGWIQFNSAVTFNQAFGGKTQVMQITGATNTWAIALKSTPAPVLVRSKRHRVTGVYYLPAANPVAKRAVVGFWNNLATKVYLPQLALDTWQPFDVESGRDQNQTGANNSLEVGMLNASGSQGGTFTPSDNQYFHDVKLYLSGCIVDLDFGRVAGNQVMDWSGRYPATLPAVYEVVRPSTITTGPVTLGLRRYATTVQVHDNGTATVTHGLGTQHLTVQVWNAAGEQVAVAANRKVGSDLTALDLSFSLIGYPGPDPAPKGTFLVVIIG